MFNYLLFVCLISLLKDCNKPTNTFPFFFIALEFLWLSHSKYIISYNISFQKYRFQPVYHWQPSCSAC